MKNLIVFAIFREMEKQKTALLDAYVRKFIAIGKIHLVTTKLNENEVTKSDEFIPWAELDVIHTELGKFIDYNDQKVDFNAFLVTFQMHLAKKSSLPTRRVSNF